MNKPLDNLALVTRPLDITGGSLLAQADIQHHAVMLVKSSLSLILLVFCIQIASNKHHY